MKIEKLTKEQEEKKLFYMDKFLNKLKEKQHLVMLLVFIAVLIGNCNSCSRGKESIELQKKSQEEFAKFQRVYNESNSS
jgi:Fe-S cluster biogenesis protein NfuA